MISSFLGMCFLYYACVLGGVEYTTSYTNIGLLLSDKHRAVYTDIVLSFTDIQAGIGAAWFEKYPKHYMATPWQFHFFVSHDVSQGWKVRYDHYSNGAKILDTRRPNKGINSFALQYSF